MSPIAIECKPTGWPLHIFLKTPLNETGWAPFYPKTDLSDSTLIKMEI